MNNKSIFPLIAVIAFFGVVCPVGPAVSVSAADEDVTAFNPPDFLLREKVEGMKQHWPDQMASGVVEAEEQPSCHSPTEFFAYSQCVVLVHPVEWFYLRWLGDSPRGPDNEFTVYYWFKEGEGRTDYQRGDRFIVFLSPAHAEDTYSTVVVLDEPAKTAGQVRTLMAEIFPLNVAPVVEAVPTTEPGMMNPVEEIKEPAVEPAEPGEQKDEPGEKMGEVQADDDEPGERMEQLEDMEAGETDMNAEQPNESASNMELPIGQTGGADGNVEEVDVPTGNPDGGTDKDADGNY